MSQDIYDVTEQENLPNFRSTALVAVGSNQESRAGCPNRTVKAALQELSQAGVVIRQKSPIYRTPAYPIGSGADFANAAIEIEAAGSGPLETLEILHWVEAAFGRNRAERWGPRTLDLDLVAFGKKILPNAETLRQWMDLPPELQTQTSPQELILPHPRLQDRAFVLVPLADIAPDWVHPTLNQTVRQLLARLPDYLRREITLYD